MEQYEGFKGDKWKNEIDVKQFILDNYTEYTGDDSFLASPTEKTKRLNDKYQEMSKIEIEKGIYDVDTKTVSGIDAYNPGYLIKDDEVIVGFQTDAPLKRIVNPFGGMRMVRQSLEAYGYKLDPSVEEYFKYRKTHNDGVFSAYTTDIRKARHAGLLTGLPDAYGRGRIIGDYRRIALYGIDRLIDEKKNDLISLEKEELTEEMIRLREEVSEQIKALGEIKSMASKYGFDISMPANNAKEAVQWLYFGYLAAIKENNGAAMSLGRTSTFLDIYFERDLKKGIITEEEAQEIIDQFIMKLRMARHLRTPEYNELFAGDPTWVTESLGGMTEDGKSLVTKNSFRYLHTLYNLGSSPEPNLTVLWSDNLPENFKKYCAKVSIDTDAIQYESDELMRPIHGCDYAIACCVSAMTVGKQMQFFGARCNLAKTLLYAINGGIDEIKKELVVDGLDKITDEYLDYESVRKAYSKAMKKIAKTYVDAMNIIHFMHDKYAYEKGQMALHDTKLDRLMAFGIAGFSVAVDSLSAIKYAKVKPIRDEDGIAVDFEITGEFPKYGNDDDKVDNLGKEYQNILQNKVYYTAFKFQEEDIDATSHFILHLTKSSRGFDLIKTIYNDFANVGTVFDGVNTYTFDVKKITNPIADLFDMKALNIDKLKDMIYKAYRGKMLSAFDLFDEHQISGNYCRRHYAIALRKLCSENKLQSTFTDNKNHSVSVLISKDCILKFD